MSGQNYSVISVERSQAESQNSRVPHPFALFAKGWGLSVSATNTNRTGKEGSTTHEPVESHPCKVRKDGAPIVRTSVRGGFPPPSPPTS
jgi:hypothetical protein